MSNTPEKGTNYIGATPTRVDAYDKATGKGMYAADYHKFIPGLLHVKVFRSPVAHCKITKLDVSKAEAMPGVERIFTVERSPFHMERLPEQNRFPVNNECIWAGQPIAIVAAETLEQAEDAIEAIEMEYEELPHILTVQEALDPNPKSIIDPFSGRGEGEIDASNPWAGIGRLDVVASKFAGEGVSPNIVGNYVLNKGDVDEAMKKADIVVEREFCCGRRNQNQLELAGSICTYNSDDSITVYGSGCGVHGVIKSAIVNIFELPETKVRSIQPYVGGSFGNRLNPYAEVFCVMMSLFLKKSCSYFYTRKEMFDGAPGAWPVYSRVKYGATKDGRVIAQDYDCVEEIGAIQNNVSYTGRLSSSGAVCVYNIDNIHMDTAATVTNTMPVGPYRGLGCPESEFGMECMMNELADELGMSAVEVRAKNFIKNGEDNGYGEKITSIGVEKCLRACAEAIDLDTPSVQEEGSPWKRGKGCAVGGKQNTPLGRAESIVRYYSDSSVEVLISCDENGMGAMTVMAQIAATTLELPIEKIKVIKGDTQLTPFDNYSASSRTTYTTGNAVKIACEEVKDKLQEAAAREVGVHKSKVAIHGDKAVIVGSDIQELPLAVLFKNTSPYEQGNWGLMRFSPVEGHGVFCPAPIRSWGHDGLTKRMWNWFQYSAAAIEIAVNEETGQVRLEKIACSADTGNPINPKMVEGQIEGGVMLAAGYVLNEEHLFNEHGAITNSGLSDYRIGDILLSPKQENFISLINPDPLPDGPFGAKGMAESITIPIAPAIAEGLYKAVGIRPTYFPMTAERVLEMIKEKKAKEAVSK